MPKIKLDDNFLKFSNEEQLILIRLLVFSDENGESTFSDRGMSRDTGIPYQRVRTLHRKLIDNGIIENADKDLPINALSTRIAFSNPSQYGLIRKKANSQTKNKIPEGSTENYRNFIRWIETNAPYIYSHMKLPNEIKFYRLKKQCNTEQIMNVILQIENRQDLRKRYVDLYLTMINWLKRDGFIQRTT